MSMTPECPASRPSLLPRWTVLIFAMLFPSLTAWIYFVTLAEPARRVGESSRASLAVLTAYAVSKIIQFGLPVVWVLGSDRASLRTLRFNRRGLAIGFL